MTENEIQRAVISHLKTRAAPSTVWWHTPNGGYRRRSEAKAFAGLGVHPGIPDLLFLRAGALYGLELKTEKGKLSDHQAVAQAALGQAGATCATAWGLDAAIAQLESWGLLRGRAA